MININSQQYVERSSSNGPDRILSMGCGGNPIVFLHGLFGTPEHWRSIMTPLADDYRVIAPQLPVDNQPQRRRNGIRTLDDLTEYVADLIFSMGLPPFVLCGNSLGGLVSIELCVRYPQHVTGLVLAGSAGLYERSLTQGVKPRPSREFVRAIASDIFSDPEMITEAMVDEWYQAVLDRDYVRFLLRVSRATRNRRLNHELKQLQMPTLIVWGRDDKVTPPDVAEAFQRQITHSRLQYIEDCGHAPNLEQPVAFTKLLRDFLPQCFSTGVAPPV
jgi:pimeloyl-ACP methyl ester carboxylesterase